MSKLLLDKQQEIFFWNIRCPPGRVTLVSVTKVKLTLMTSELQSTAASQRREEAGVGRDGVILQRGRNLEWSCQGMFVCGGGGWKAS